MDEMTIDSIENSPLTGEEVQLLDKVSSHYEQILKESLKAQEFLRRHGLNDAETLQKYRVGYCDGSLPKDREAKALLNQLGILNEKGKEVLKSCATVPILNEGNVPLAIYAIRLPHLDIEACLPSKSKPLFNAHYAKGKERLFVTNGVLDALSLLRHGHQETVAIIGERIPDDGMAVFEDPALKSVYFFMDEASIHDHMRQINNEGLEFYRVPIPEKAECLSRYMAVQSSLEVLLEGAKKIEALYPKANGAEGNKIPFKVLREDSAIFFVRGDLTYRIKGLNVRRVNSLKTTIKIYNDHSYHLDTFDLYSARARSVFARQVSTVMELDEQMVTNDLRVIVEALEDIQLEMLGEEPVQEAEVMTEAEKTEALDVLKSGDLIERIIADAKQCAYVGEEKNLLLGYLVSISRKLKQPLALFIISQSGAGKTELQDRVLSFTPPEDYIKLTRLTDQSLFYQGQETLARKMITVEEEEGVTGAGYSIRHLLSANNLSSMTTIRDEATGKLKAIRHQVKGPVSMMITTTNPEVNYETYNRFLIVSVDESHSQTQRILEIQRHLETFEGALAQRQHTKIQRLHQNMQRLLEPIDVVNPYAEKLRFVDSILRARREQKKYHSLIKAVALLRQHQKEIKTGKDGDEHFRYIEVDKTDIKIANDLAREFLLKGLDELTPQGRSLIKLIKELVQKTAKATGVAEQDLIISRRDIRAYTGWSNYQLRKQIHELVQLEYLYPLCGRQGKKYAYKLVWDGAAWSEKDLNLVDVDTL